MMDIFYYDGALKRAQRDELEKLRYKAIWVDVTDMSKEGAELLKKIFNLHPLTIEDFMQAYSRIKIEEFGDYIVGVFYGIKRGKSYEPYELDFVLGKNFLITNHKGEIPSFSEMKENADRLQELFNKGLDFLFHRLLDKEIDNYMPVMEGIDDEIEDIEEKAIKKASPELLSKILKLKRNIIKIKKVTMPQREKISMLTRNQYAFITKKSLPYFRDVYDHSIVISDAVDSYREGIANTFDVYMSTISNNMNDVMKILSIIATIALPLTVISGIYGTNFSILPGQHYVYGFWVMIIVMILLSIGMIFFFKKRNWF